MNNPEFEQDILNSIDKSGYSEKQTDLKIDKLGNGGQTIKQFNKQTKSAGFQHNNTVVTLKKKKQVEVIFDADK